MQEGRRAWGQFGTIWDSESLKEFQNKHIDLLKSDKCLFKWSDLEPCVAPATTLLRYEANIKQSNLEKTDRAQTLACPSPISSPRGLDAYGRLVFGPLASRGALTYF